MCIRDSRSRDRSLWSASFFVVTSSKHEDITTMKNTMPPIQVSKLTVQYHDSRKPALEGVQMTVRESSFHTILGPNGSGKSSLINLISGQETAIVTDIAGTTRDVLKAQVEIDGLSIEFYDTAGLRDDPDLIEAEGDLETIGKSIESDKTKNKAAYPILFGLDQSKERVDTLYKDACEYLSIFEENANPLMEMAEIVIKRKL